MAVGHYSNAADGSHKSDTTTVKVKVAEKHPPAHGAACGRRVHRSTIYNKLCSRDDVSGYHTSSKSAYLCYSFTIGAHMWYRRSCFGIELLRQSFSSYRPSLTLHTESTVQAPIISVPCQVIMQESIGLRDGVIIKDHSSPKRSGSQKI